MDVSRSSNIVKKFRKIVLLINGLKDVKSKDFLKISQNSIWNYSFAPFYNSFVPIFLKLHDFLNGIFNILTANKKTV